MPRETSVPDRGRVPDRLVFGTCLGSTDDSEGVETGGRDETRVVDKSRRSGQSYGGRDTIPTKGKLNTTATSVRTASKISGRLSPVYMEVYDTPTDGDGKTR